MSAPTKPTVKPAAKRVVICVFDGLRPDFVTPERMPNLAAFAGGAAWFSEARSVFPSMTRVATTSIATGAPPAVHGIVGNAFLFPEVTREHVLDMSAAADIALAETRTGGRLVEAQSFGDVLAAAGKKLAVVHTGSAGSAYLINPRARANGHWTFSIFGREHTQTPEAVDEVVARFGPLPPRNLPRFEEIDYAARVLTEHVLAGLKPDVALVWFNEPDTSFHYRELGSAETLAVVSHVDAAFGRIRDWIAAQPDAADYAVLIASDHGQISTNGQIRIVDELSAQGHKTFRAVERTLAGAAVSVTGGNMGEIRILEGGTARRDAIAAWLTEQDWLGMLFSAGRNEVEGEVEGSFSLSLVDLDHARKPDLVFVLRSDGEADPYGFPGLGLLTQGDVAIGGGMHGGLNRHELSTVLMLAGPGIAAGRRDPRPAGIIDIGPTVLDLLGLQPAATMRGEALTRPDRAAMPRHFETGAGRFRQGLNRADRKASRILLAGGRI